MSQKNSSLSVGNPVDFGPVLDVITTGAPLRLKPVREVVKAIGGFLVTVPEPVSVAFGLSLVGLATAFEKRYGKKGRKR